MNIEKCYKEFDGDYQGVVERLIKEDRILKYLLKFKDGNYYEEISRNLKDKDYVNAFRNVHNLKGLSLNLGMSNLAKSSSNLCEVLRDGEPTVDVGYMVLEMKNDYTKVLEAIKNMENE